MVEAGHSGESAKGRVISDFGSNKGAMAIGIRQAWNERGRIRRGSTDIEG